jgi:hypothetical protein
MEGIICTKKGAQSAACIVCLGPAFGGEFYSVVGDGLVDVTVLYCKSVLAVSHHYASQEIGLFLLRSCYETSKYHSENVLLPSD